jgi:hypothetical protein
VRLGALRNAAASFVRTLLAIGDDNAVGVVGVRVPSPVGRVFDRRSSSPDTLTELDLRSASAPRGVVGIETDVPSSAADADDDDVDDVVDVAAPTVVVLAKLPDARPRALDVTGDSGAVGDVARALSHNIVITTNHIDTRARTHVHSLLFARSHRRRSVVIKLVIALRRMTNDMSPLYRGQTTYLQPQSLPH